MAESLLSKKTFCVITGASRGLGKSIAQKFGTKFPSGSTLLLMARNTDKLQEVAAGIKASNPTINVVYRGINLANLEACAKELFNTILTESGTKVVDFEQAMIVHNAGSTGDLTKYASQVTDRKMLEEMMNINVTGTILINNSFLSTFTREAVHARVIINITSKSATVTVPTTALYSAVKAARDMFFLSLAREDEDIRVLTYGPGGMDTEMAKYARENSASEFLRQTFTKMYDEGKLLPCEVATEKLTSLLETNSFESGVPLHIEDL